MRNMAEVLSRQPLRGVNREWQCPHCTAVNMAADIDCRVCTKAKPGRRQLAHHLHEEQSQLPEEGPVKQSFVDNVKSLVLGKPLPWQCPRCTAEMGGYYNKCTVCGFLRTDIRRKSDSSVISDLFSKFRRSPDRSKRASRETSSVDPTRDSDYQEDCNKSGWNCPQCTLINGEKARVCSVCGCHKPSKQKRDYKKVKENRHHLEDSFEILDNDNESIKVPQSSLLFDEEVFDSMCTTLQDKDNQLPQLHCPTDHATVAVPTEPSALVTPTSTNPKHTSLPSSSSPLQPNQQPQPHPSSHPRPYTDVIGDPNASSWKCSVCGAFNLIFAENQKCFVCGIGLIPFEVIDAVNNRTHPHPRSLVVPSYPVPRHEGYGQLVYTIHPNLASLLPQPSDEHHMHGRVENSEQLRPQPQPQRPTRLSIEMRPDEGSRTGRRRRNSSVRRSAEDSLGTPARNTTVLRRVVKHQYELEADRIYKDICQYCGEVMIDCLCAM